MSKERQHKPRNKVPAVRGRNSGYLSKKAALTHIRAEDSDIVHSKTLDCVIITLGKMGCDEEFLHKFFDEYGPVETEVHGYFEEDWRRSLEDLVVDDVLTELKFADTKDKLDRLIKQYVYPEDFKDFDTRYHMRSKTT